MDEIHGCLSIRGFDHYNINKNFEDKYYIDQPFITLASAFVTRSPYFAFVSCECYYTIKTEKDVFSILYSTSCVYIFSIPYSSSQTHGPLTRCAKLRVVHAPGMPGTFSLPPRISDPDMHHGTCVTHVPWFMPESLTSGFFWSRWRGKTFQAFPMHAQPAIYVSGKRSM